MPDVRVAKIVIEAPITSFRYPHFLIGRQLTFEMPPPATIYGHIASALGELPRRDGLRFAYHFEYTAKGQDLEHQRIVTPAGPRSSFEVDGAKYPKNLDVTVQPHLREFLYGCRLTLYIEPPEIGKAFLAPVFCVILGRSQDLASITSVEELDLVAARGAYFEHTLLPFSWRPHLALGITTLMPRYISPPPERVAEFERYIGLRERIFAGECENPDGLSPARRIMSAEPPWQELEVDPQSATIRGVQRGICFHGFLPR